MNDLLMPLKAVVLADRQYWREEEGLITRCPACESQMWIADKSFICSDDHCSFSRGGALDYLAAVAGGYSQAISLASEDIPYYRENPENEVRSAQLRRNLLEFAISAERHNMDMDKERVRLRQEFASNLSAPHTAFRRGHWFLTTEQSNRLVLLLCELDITPPPNLQGRPSAIAPFWGNLHTLGALYILGAGMKTFEILPVFPYRCSWFGLQQMRPSNEKLAVFDQYHQALQNEATYRVCDHQWFPTSAHVNARASLSGKAFKNLRFIITRENYQRYLPRWSLIDGFDEAEFFFGSEESLTLPALLERLIAECQGNFTSFTDLCQAMRLGTAARAYLLKLSDFLPNAKNGIDLRKILSRKLMTVDEKGAIYEYPDGYYAECLGVLKRVSNFTLQLDKMVCFSSMQEARYVGRAYIGTSSLQFDITGPKLEQPSILEENLRNLQTIAMLEDQSVSATIILAKEFRRVMEALRVKRAELPRFVGVNSLGWNHRFDSFSFPHLIIDSQGIHQNVTYHPEESGEHHCWSDREPLPNTPSSLLPLISPEVAELISALIAQSLRLYHAKSTRLWPILNNEGRTKALKIFRGLGQVSIMRLTQFVNRNFDLNRGLPCLITLNNDLQASKVRMAGAWLAEHGQDLSRVSDDEIETAALLLPSLLSEIVRRLCAGETVSYKEKRSVEPLSAIAEEGASLIRKDFWADWPLAGTKWQSINTLLERKEFMLPRLVKIEAQSNTLFLPQELWLDLEVDPTNLIIELGLLNLQAEPKEKGLRVDRSGMNRVFTDFYGKVPELLAV